MEHCFDFVSYIPMHIIELKGFSILLLFIPTPILKFWSNYQWNNVLQGIFKCNWKLALIPQRCTYHLNREKKIVVCILRLMYRIIVCKISKVNWCTLFLFQYIWLGLIGNALCTMVSQTFTLLIQIWSYLGDILVPWQSLVKLNN